MPIERFISKTPDLVLYNTDGKVRIQFVDGVYIGSIAATDCYDVTNAKFILQPKRSLLDLLGVTVGGATVVYEEICGLGSLNGYSNVALKNGMPDTTITGTALDPVPETAMALGMKGIFFRSPLLTADNVTGYVITTLGYYTVDNSSTCGVFYNGILYNVGDTFHVKTLSATPAVNTVLSAVGGSTAIFFLDTPPLDNTNQFTREAFKLAHLEVGDEVQNYWLTSGNGFTPHANAGWTR